MSRFSKSAMFPILIVVILAFFAQQLISSPNKKKDPGFGTFTSQLNSGQIKSVEMQNRSNELAVTLKDKSQYSIGFASAYGRTHGLAWLPVVLGAWTFVAPWVIQGTYASGGAIANNIVIGVITIALGLVMMRLPALRSR